MFSTFKKTTLAIATASLLGISSVASAGYNMPVPAPLPGGNWYVGIVGGGVFTPDLDARFASTGIYDFKNGYDVGARTGYRVGPFRFEGEFNYQHNKLDDTHNANGSFVNNGGTLNGKLNVHSLLVNAFYDFNEVSDNFGVYMGGGVGAASFRLKTEGSGDPITLGTHTLDVASAKQTRFAYQGMLGFNFNVDSNFVVDVGYRYFGASKPSKLFSERYQTHLVNLGLNYQVPA